MEIHIKKALDAGITEAEITEVFSQSAMSGGIPCMMFAADVFREMKENDFKFLFLQYDIEGD